MKDIVVVGGGPAGLCAALYGLRNGKSVLIIEKEGFGGQITSSSQVENIPGFLTISGNEFTDNFLQQVLTQGGEIELEKVVGVEDHREFKRVLTEAGIDYDCRTVILATGVKHRLLGLEGETELIGNGVSFCAVCDGDFFRGKTVCVAGGGNSALQEAILLCGKAKKVIVLQDLPEFTGESRLQEILLSHDNVETYTSMTITGLHAENGILAGVKTSSKETGKAQEFACDGLFVAIGLIPENKAFEGVAQLDGAGYFESDESCLTRTPGVFVAGDCRKKQIRQVATAISDGAIAALTACRYIDAQR